MASSSLAVSIMLLLYCLSLEDPDFLSPSLPLLNAAEAGHDDVVETLLNNGADIQQRNYYGLTGDV